MNSGTPNTTRPAGTLAEVIAALVAIIGADDRIDAVYLLGSGARDALRPDSDLDLALLLANGKAMSVGERVQLAVDLEVVAGRTVDIGVLTHDNLIYAKEAITSGRCVFHRSIFRRDLFAATAMSLYGQLRFERREIENAYRT